MTSPLSRREFIKLGAIGATGLVLAGCKGYTRWVTLEPYVNAPEDQVSGNDTWYASTCRQCPAGCGILVRVMNGRALKIEGNPNHPISQGKLCARGQASLQELYNPDRLQFPVKQSERGTRAFSAISWEEGINTLFTQLKKAGTHVAVWVGSSMSAHLYELLSRFTKAIGAPSPLIYDLFSQMNASATLSHVQGELSGVVQVPSYSIGQADVVFSFNEDFLGIGQSAVRYGVEYGQFRQQRSGSRGTLVQFEPRMSITGAVADRWVPVTPGWEGALAQALIRLIADGRLGDAELVARARQLRTDVDIDSVAARCETDRSELTNLARLFATAESPVAIGGGPVGGLAQGADALKAIQGLNYVANHALVANAENDSVLADFIKPTAATYAQAQKLIGDMKAGEIEAMLVFGANPVYDLPQQSGFQDALENVPFIASFSPMVDETVVWADLVLPDRTPLESWGADVSQPDFGQTILSSQQPIVQPLYGGHSSADVLLTVARGLPAAAAVLPWTDEVAYLKEKVTQNLAEEGWDASEDVIWSRFLQYGGWWKPQQVSGSAAQLFSVDHSLDNPQYQGGQDEYPYYLKPYLSNLLSDGRGASQTWLQGAPDPMTTVAWQTWVEINPKTAEQLSLSSGDIVQVTSPAGSIEAPVYVYPAIRPDTVAIPMGQGHSDLGRYAQQRGANAVELFGSQTDTSGQYLAWANLRVKIEPTGRRQQVARFESSEGVEDGFINKDFPG